MELNKKIRRYEELAVSLAMQADSNRKLLMMSESIRSEDLRAALVDAGSLEPSEFKRLDDLRNVARAKGLHYLIRELGRLHVLRNILRSVEGMTLDDAASEILNSGAKRIIPLKELTKHMGDVTFSSIGNILRGMGKDDKYVVVFTTAGHGWLIKEISAHNFRLPESSIPLDCFDIVYGKGDDIEELVRWLATENYVNMILVTEDGGEIHNDLSYIADKYAMGIRVVEAK